MLIGIDQPLITQLKLICAFKYNVRFSNDILSYYFTKDNIEIVFENGIKINVKYEDILNKFN